MENCANVTALLLRLSGDWQKIVNIPICVPCRIRLAKRAEMTRDQQRASR